MTVYLEDNTSSHSRPVIDSLRVLRPLLAFSASSFAAFGIDTLAPMVLTRLTGILWVSVLAATGAPEALIGARDPGRPGGALPRLNRRTATPGSNLPELA